MASAHPQNTGQQDDGSACSYHAPVIHFEPNASLAADVRPYIAGWFDNMNRHVDIEEVVSRLDPDGFVVAFPGEAFCSEEAIRAWYADEASIYHNQDHKIIKLSAGGDPQHPTAYVTVSWTATDSRTGEVIQNRLVDQVWQFRRTSDGTYLITLYGPRDDAG